MRCARLPSRGAKDESANPVSEIINAPWLGILVGAVFVVASIVISYILYKRSRPVTRLRRVLYDVPLIGPAPSEYGGLEIRYEGANVARATRTIFGVWNDGTTTIRGGDIVEKDPLRLELPEHGPQAILRATVDASTRDVNDVQIIDSSRSKVVVAFDYLDPGDGFRMEVLHSGAPWALKAMGTIRGLPTGITPYDPEEELRRNQHSESLVIAVVASVIFTIMIASQWREIAQNPWASLAFVMVTVCLGFVLNYTKRMSERKDWSQETSECGDPIDGAPHFITDGRVRRWESRGPRR